MGFALQVRVSFLRDPGEAKPDGTGRVFPTEVHPVDAQRPGVLVFDRVEAPEGLPVRSGGLAGMAVCGTTIDLDLGGTEPGPQGIEAAQTHRLRPDQQDPFRILGSDEVSGSFHAIVPGIPGAVVAAVVDTSCRLVAGTGADVPLRREVGQASARRKAPPSQPLVLGSVGAARCVKRRARVCVPGGRIQRA